ncbi:hypothetical protein DIE18_31275 [Burkholderia sp. Bp9125]|nr:hypothetical protein DIE18_31275 [Burkholderia sp. Bp9125]
MRTSILKVSIVLMSNLMCEEDALFSGIDGIPVSIKIPGTSGRLIVSLGHASLGPISIYGSPEKARLRREAAKWHAHPFRDARDHLHHTPSFRLRAFGARSRALLLLFCRARKRIN